MNLDISKNKINVQRVKTFITAYHAKHSLVPSVKVISEKCGLAESNILEVLAYLRSSGFLIKKGPGRPPSSMQNIDSFSVNSEVVLSESKKKTNRSILGYKIILLSIASGSMAVSVYYTTIWCMSYLPVFLAFLLSLIMVLYSSFTPNIIFKLWSMKKRIISIVSVLPWFIVLTFSMFSTVAGQFSKFIRYEISAQTTISTANNNFETRYENYNEMILFLKERINAIEKQKNILLENIKRSGDKILPAQQKSLNELNDDIKKISEQILDLQGQKNISLESVSLEEKPVVYLSIFDWLSGIFGIKADIIQLIISVWPAIFLDLIAPLCLLSFEMMKGEVNGLEQSRQRPAKQGT